MSSSYAPLPCCAHALRCVDLMLRTLPLPTTLTGLQSRTPSHVCMPSPKYFSILERPALAIVSPSLEERAASPRSPPYAPPAVGITKRADESPQREICMQD